MISLRLGIILLHNIPLHSHANINPGLLLKSLVYLSTAQSFTCGSAVCMKGNSPVRPSRRCSTYEFACSNSDKHCTAMLTWLCRYFCNATPALAWSDALRRFPMTDNVTSESTAQCSRSC